MEVLARLVGAPISRISFSENTGGKGPILSAEGHGAWMSDKKKRHVGIAGSAVIETD